MESRLPTNFVWRLHRGLVGFIAERFERGCDSSDAMKGYRLVSDDGLTVCDNQDYYPAETDPEHIRRILACLHYCNGMATEDLERQNALLGTNR